MTRRARTISAFATRTDPLGAGDGLESKLPRERADRVLGGLAVEPDGAGERRIRPEAAEHDVGVGDRRLACLRARNTAGPGTAPALRGPTRSAPPGSRHAIDPPPAPTVWMSTIASASGRPPTSRPAVSRTAPCSTTQTSHDVPPMSKQTRSVRPLRRATSAAAAAPPAGPESTVNDACRAASSAAARPPLDCMIRGSGSPASLARASSRRR